MMESHLYNRYDMINAIAAYVMNYLTKVIDEVRE